MFTLGGGHVTRGERGEGGGSQGGGGSDEEEGGGAFSFRLCHTGKRMAAHPPPLPLPSREEGDLTCTTDQGLGLGRQWRTGGEQNDRRPNQSSHSLQYKEHWSCAHACVHQHTAHAALRIATPVTHQCACTLHFWGENTRMTLFQWVLFPENMTALLSLVLHGPSVHDLHRSSAAPFRRYGCSPEHRDPSPWRANAHSSTTPSRHADHLGGQNGLYLL